MLSFAEETTFAFASWLVVGTLTFALLASEELHWVLFRVEPMRSVVER